MSFDPFLSETDNILHVGKISVPDYMENFSQGSERNPPEMKVAITWRRIQPGRKILAARIFILATRAEKYAKSP